MYPSWKVYVRSKKKQTSNALRKKKQLRKKREDDYYKLLKYKPQNFKSPFYKMPDLDDGDLELDDIEIDARVEDSGGMENPIMYGEVCLITESPFAALQCAKKGDVNKLLDLLNAKPRLAIVKDRKKGNIFHYAAKYGRANIIDAIFNFSPEIGQDLMTSADDFEEMPLHWAVRFNQSETVKVLLGKKADHEVYNRRGFAPIHLAVDCTSLDALMSLIECKVDLNAKARNGKTALHIAAYQDNDEVAKILLQQGASQCVFCNQGCRPLHVAAAAGSKKVMELLLENCGKYGVSREKMLSYNDNEDNTPLHSAVSGGNKEAIRICLEYGARLDVKQSDESTPVHVLCAQGNLETIEFMFQVRPDQALRSLSMLDKDNHTPLHKAAMFNHIEIIRFLVDNGADIDLVDVDHRSPLLVAASRGSMESVKVLLEYLSDPKLKDKNGQNLLHLLVLRGGNICRLGRDYKRGFIKFFSDILSQNEVNLMLNETDSLGCTPMHYACQQGNLASLTALLKLGVSAREKTCKSQSPLHFASMYGRYNACKRLLDSSQGPHIINEKDADGYTPLHLASMNGHFKVVQLLLNRGANIYRSNKGKTAVHVATGGGFIKTLRVLVDTYRHLIDQKDEDGNTPLHVAAQEGQVMIVTVLLDLNADILVNNQGFTAFVIAIFNQNATVANAFVMHNRWEEIMETIITPDNRAITPSFLLVKFLPETFQNVLNRCMTVADCDPKSFDYWIRYDFKYLQPDAKKLAAIRKIFKFHDMSNQSSPDKKKLETEQKNKTAAKTQNKQNTIPPLPVLNKMVDFNRVESLRHPVSRAYLQHKWHAYGRLVHNLHVCFFLMSLVPLSYIVLTTDYIAHLEADGSIYRRNMTNAASPEVVSPTDEDMSELVSFDHLQYIMMFLIIFVNGVELIKELIQAYHQRFVYFTDIQNLFEMCLYISCLLYVTPFIFGYSYHWQFEIGAIAIFLAWFNLLLFLQKFDIYGVYVTMFLQVYKTLIQVIMVFSILIFAFCFSFHLLMPTEIQGAFTNPVIAYITMISMLLGEIGWKEYYIGPLEDTKKETLHLSFSTHFMIFFLMITLPILLMNLLIGLAVGDIAQVQNNAQLQALAMQVRSHSSIEKHIPIKILIRVDKTYTIEYPNRCTGSILKNFFILICGGEETETSFQVNEQAQDTMYDPLHHELLKQKQRMKDMQNVLDRQHDLLRLIVQKMDIHEEAEDQDEGYVPDQAPFRGSLPATSIRAVTAFQRGLRR